IAGSALAQQPAPAAPPAAAVGVVAAETRAISQSMDFVGRITAVERVEVKARIEGYLEEVLFKEGEVLKAGTPLYRIEKGTYEAAVQQAQGELERSKASLTLAVVQRERAAELLAKGVGTVVARDQAVAAESQAKGAMLTNEANLRNAQINLGYTDIVSPITGRIGRSSLTKGNVVRPDSGVLTEIVSQDPMYVEFPVSQRDFLQMQERGNQTGIASIKVRVRFSNGRVYDQVGAINFVNVKVDRATDTILVRADMPNPAGALTDGQFVQVVLESGTPTDRVLIPQSALITDQQGIYVFVVQDNKAVVKRVKTGGVSGAQMIVEEGVAAGDQVIVQGLQTVRPGAAVKATPVQSDIKQ
ncbi:MAG: transporter subunit, partial [Alphaproteobacteria bacterium]|nr:transporter subunit [Alphaproteobacteria bacterium]